MFSEPRTFSEPVCMSLCEPTESHPRLRRLLYLFQNGGSNLCSVDDSNDHVLSVWDWQREEKLADVKVLCGSVREMWRLVFVIKNPSYLTLFQTHCKNCCLPLSSAITTLPFMGAILKIKISNFSPIVLSQYKFSCHNTEGSNNVFVTVSDGVESGQFAQLCYKWAQKIRRIWLMPRVFIYIRPNFILMLFSGLK